MFGFFCDQLIHLEQQEGDSDFALEILYEVVWVTLGSIPFHSRWNQEFILYTGSFSRMDALYVQ